jgi:chromosome segregation ATPase
MVEMNQAMARLRLVLAEINQRVTQVEQQVRQFRLQERRLPRQAIYGRAPLDLSLSAMGEVEERLADALANQRRLLSIKKRAEEELKALEVTRQVEDAKSTLSALRQDSKATGGPNEEAAAEMRRLEQFIAEYSKVAERAITDMAMGDMAEGGAP